ncbi:CcmD family protein [Pedobacter sp. HMWF019]|uniref:CcmD family protein n=1 Tax=Pedobacter sp. HMWF019 TaxID=2056856 RepID=UPI000D36FBB4|nr:CcmD family protein [Pedobacter sp. HMWF019]PTS94313.1 CcmD family protein [Pedobacter sp. HMWF019]
MKKFIVALALLFSSVQLFAQTDSVEMADVLRSNGKIYVVVLCIVIILAGLLFYLFSLDRRLKKIEKKSTGKN